MSEWHDVNDRLPDDADVVVVAVESRFVTFGYHTIRDGWKCGYREIDIGVTQWRYLPVPEVE